MEKIPRVSVVVPCRNEEKFISKCLDSVLANDYPKDNLEILVIDGMSQDKTREIIKKYARQYPFIKLLDNPKYITPCALNIGIGQSKGEIIVRMDSHATYEKDYIRKCIDYLGKYKADNVGGIIKTVSSGNTLMAKSIAICMGSGFGAGNSYFRVGAEKPIEADTVFGGCYRKEIFDKIGLFNESLKRSQDMEFNMRLKGAGGKIILAPDIVAYYYPSSKLKDFFLHNFNDGIWATYPLKFVKMPFRPRHYVPLVFVSALIISFLLGLFFRPFSYIFSGIIFLYVLAVLYSAIKVFLKEKKAAYLLSLPVVFAARHIGYGLGSIAGIIKILFQ